MGILSLLLQATPWTGGITISISQVTRLRLGKLSNLSKKTWALLPLPHPKSKTLQGPLPDSFGLFSDSLLPSEHPMPTEIRYPQLCRKYNFLLPEGGIMKHKVAKVKAKTKPQRTSYQKCWSHHIWIGLDTAYVCDVFQGNYLSHPDLNQDT